MYTEPKQEHIDIKIEAMQKYYQEKIDGVEQGVEVSVIRDRTIVNKVPTITGSCPETVFIEDGEMNSLRQKSMIKNSGVMRFKI